MITRVIGNFILKVILLIPTDNRGSWIPDFHIEVYVLGVKVLSKRVTL